MSRDKLKTLTLLCHHAYGHEACQGDEILWRASTHKFAWPLNDVVLLGHVAN